jgi:hypothetical protein
MGEEHTGAGLVQPATTASRAGGNPLGFSLEFCEGSALVTLQKRPIEHLLVEKLALEVPNVTFPFDVAGGAEQFRHHRCRLRMLELTLSQDELGRLLTRLLDPARYGIVDVQVGIKHGQGLLSGQWQVGEQSASFTARFVIEAEEDLSIRVGWMDVRVFGPLPLPATALASQLNRAPARRGVGMCLPCSSSGARPDPLAASCPRLEDPRPSGTAHRPGGDGERPDTPGLRSLSG